MTRLLLLTLLTAVAAFPLEAQEFIPLWPESAMPNSKGLKRPEVIVNERILQVETPGMYVFLPSAKQNTGSAVVICPGGGYERLAYVSAGLELAKWLNTLGVNAFVLKYRLPNSPDLKVRHIAPLQDAQRAMRVVRSNAARWAIDPAKIGVLGTSAGGHLASTLGTHSEDVSAIGDSLDAVSFRPDFMILVSPVVSMGVFAHAGSRENLLGAGPSAELRAAYSNESRVTPATPTCFLVHAFDDRVVPVQNSLMFYRALVDKGISSSLHVFPEGDHAIALRGNPGSTELWTALGEMWLKEKGFISGPSGPGK